jgi:hypothetical protein
MKQLSSRASYLGIGLWISLLLMVAVLLLTAAAPAQGQEPRLAGRLPDGARAQIDAILDSARAGGLPTEPLVDRALEGATKGAPPARILAAVVRLRDELVTTRRAFGPDASQAELVAGASALRAGATPDGLGQLRKLRAGQPLTVAAAVLADLVSAGVPADTAVGAVLSMASEAADADYVAFRRNVQRDIALGASPAAALGVRLRAMTGPAAEYPGTNTGTGGRRKQKP